MNIRKLLAAALVGVMAAGTVAPSALANTAPSSLTQRDPIYLLRKFGIVQGYEDGSLRLEQLITRAEMIKVIVTAAGDAQYANMMQGQAAFSDTAKHWASGYIALAKARGYANGYPDGTFQPNKNVTYEEVIAFISRVVNLQPEPGLPYPANYISAAQKAGIIPADLDIQSLVGKNAIRGDVFRIADLAFSNVKTDGKNLYQRVFDSVPPQLMVSPLPAQVDAPSVTVRGTVEPGATLLVNDEPVWALQDGTFAVEVQLQLGENEIKVTAIDEVGNENTQTLRVTRVNSAIAGISVDGSLTVAAGAQTQLPVTVVDTYGEPVSGAEMTVTVEPEDLGTFENGVFTAGTKAQSGTITVTAAGKTAKVEVTVTPAELASLVVTASEESVAPGTLVTLSVVGKDQYGNDITDIQPTLTLDRSGALLDAATGSFIGSVPGIYTVTATVGDVTGTVKIGVHDSEVRDVKVTAPAKVIGNSAGNQKGTAYEITVAAVDRNGVVVSTFDGPGFEFIPYAPSGVIIEAIDDHAKKGVQRFAAYFDALLEGTEVDLEFEAFEDGVALPIDVGEVSINVEPQKASGLKVEYADEYLVANHSDNVARITVVVVDQNGVPMRFADVYDLTATISGPAEFENGGKKLDDIAAYPDADLYIYSQSGRTGSVSVTISGKDLGSVTVPLKAVVAGDPSGVKIKTVGNKTSAKVGDDFDAEDSVIEFILTSVDDSGIPVPADEDLDVTVDISVAREDAQKVHFRVNGVTIDPDVDQVKGIALGTLLDGETRMHIEVVSEVAGSITFTFKAGNYPAAKQTVKFEPGAAAKIVVEGGGTVDLPVLLPVSKPETTFTARLADEFGNPVAKSGVELVVTGLDEDGNETKEVTINGSTRPQRLRTNEKGEVRFTVRTRPYVDTSYGFSVEGGTYESGMGYLVVVNAIPSRVRVDIKAWDEDSDRIGSSLTSPPAGTEAVAVITIEDSYGVPFTEDDPVADYVKVLLNGKELGGTLTYDKDLRAWYTEPFQLTKSGTNTVDVQINTGTAIVKGRDSVNVVAGAASKVGVAEANDSGEVTVREDRLTTLTVRATDDWGNPKSFSTSRYFTVKVKDEDGKDTTKDVEVRLTQYGASIVDRDGALELKSTRTLYVIGRVPGTYTISFYEGSELHGEVKLIVED